MLKRIRKDQVRLGMFIDSLEGSWFSHPFWASRFPLSNRNDLKALQNSAIDWLWIDISRGLDVLVMPEVVNEEPIAPPPSPKFQLIDEPDTSVPESLSDFDQALELLNRSKGAVIGIFREARMGTAIDVARCLPQVEEFCDSLSRDTPVLLSLARLKDKDEYTYMHSVAVSALMIALARQLGMDEKNQRIAGLAGLLHDIGKTILPPSILNKPGRLADTELLLMRMHPQQGHEILQGLVGLPEQVLDACLQHHERYDGSGYPQRLSGKQISLFARMTAICDVYDALTSDRPYKSAWDAAAALARMVSWEGHFDHQLLQAFVKVVGIYPIGSLVRLRSELLGVVTAQNSENLTRPQVKVFYCARRRQVVPTEVLDLADATLSDSIAQREDPARWGFNNLEVLWLPDTRGLHGVSATTSFGHL